MPKFLVKVSKNENYYFPVQHQEILLTDFKAHIFLLISINRQFPHALEAAKQLKRNRLV